MVQEWNADDADSADKRGFFRPLSFMDMMQFGQTNLQPYAEGAFSNARHAQLQAVG